jgi:hypothetical protein
MVQRNNTQEDKILLCIDCIYCRTKNLKYYCLFGKFYKNNFSDIMLFVPEDFDCESWEEDE